MTDNHLLLYRLAELMLEKEQHILPVDSLFEDEQIGGFVRSINIDSPYQQLLLQGVFTETLKNNQVMVSFTVEGYFHYVLGEVIAKQSEGEDPEYLKSIIENNKLKGALEGVEQCLVRDIEKNDLSRLMWLIDEGGKSLEASSYPLAQAFLIHPIKRVLDELLDDPTENDIEVLENTIKKLSRAEKNNLTKDIYSLINNKVEPKTYKSAILFIKSIKHLNHSKRKILLKRIALMKFKNLPNSNINSSFFYNIGEQYLYISEYDKSLEYFIKSMEMDEKDNNSTIALAKSYNAIGNIYIDLNENKKALEYFKKSYHLIRNSKSNEKTELLINCKQNIGLAYLEINLKQSFQFLKDSLNESIIYFGKNHSMTSEAYFNLGLNLKYNKEYEKALEFYLKGLNIDQEIYDPLNPKIAQTYANIGSVYYEIKEVKKAIFFINKSLVINKKHFGYFHLQTAIDLLNLGWINSDLNKVNLAKNYLKSAKQIFDKILNKNHDYSTMTNKKLEELNNT